MKVLHKDERQSRRERIRRRIRPLVRGTAERPRVCIYKSNTAFYAQLIDDSLGRTLASVDTRQFKGKNLSHVLSAAQLFAEAAKKSGVEAVVFDRAGYLYHGSVKAFSEALRGYGLKH